MFYFLPWIFFPILPQWIFLWRFYFDSVILIIWNQKPWLICNSNLFNSCKFCCTLISVNLKLIQFISQPSKNQQSDGHKYWSSNRYLIPTQKIDKLKKVNNSIYTIAQIVLFLLKCAVLLSGLMVKGFAPKRKRLDPIPSGLSS